MGPARPSPAEKAGAFQAFQVLRDDIERKVERIGQLGDAIRPDLQHFQHPAPGGMAEGKKDMVELRLAMFSLTHMDE